MTGVEMRNPTWREASKMTPSEIWRLTRSMEVVPACFFVFFHLLAFFCAACAGMAPLPANLMFIVLAPAMVAGAWWVWFTAVEVRPSSGDEDTWRAGFKAANAHAFDYDNWDALEGWTRACASMVSPAERRRQATDLSNTSREYNDTFIGGWRDACIGLANEMQFIAAHNWGDKNRHFELMRDWMEKRDLDRVIPPGHF